MLDYTTREKRVLSVKLKDERTVLLCPPKKKLFTKLAEIESKINAAETQAEMYDEILQLSADILSSNKSGTKFSAEDVDEIMDIEDMAALIFAYSEYAGKIVKNPN